MIRAIIASAAIAAAFTIWMDEPKPVKSIQVVYCVITYKAAGQDQYGVWHRGWAQGYGQCSQLDRYENI